MRGRTYTTLVLLAVFALILGGPIPALGEAANQVIPDRG